jgi:hypothetical protein
MRLRHRDVLGRRIGSHHRGAEPRERLAQNAATAADIEETQIGETPKVVRIAAEMLGRAVADIGKPHRIEFVQGRHRPPRVPPVVGQPGEAGEFLLVDGFGAVGLWDHAKACS